MSKQVLVDTVSTGEENGRGPTGPGCRPPVSRDFRSSFLPGIVFNDPPDITMYHAVVKRIARNAFEDLSDRKVEPLIERAALDLQHTFAGDHALGGTRHSREAFRAWMARLYRLFPELTFTIRDVTDP